MVMSTLLPRSIKCWLPHSSNSSKTMASAYAHVCLAMMCRLKISVDSLPSMVAEFGDVETNPLSFDRFLEVFESQVVPKYIKHVRVF